MIGKFKDAFKQKKPNAIPDPIIKALSNDLPNGFKYVPINEDTLIIEPDQIEKLTISIPNLIELLPEDVNVKTSTEFAQFLYNAQEEIEIENDKLIINNQEFSLNQIVLHPLKNLNLKNTLIMKPQPFDKPIKILLSSDEENIHYNILLNRIPYRSVYTQKFEVIGIKNIEITFYFNLQDSSMSMNLNYSLGQDATVEDLLNNLKILRAFKNNTIKFNGDIFGGTFPTIEEEIIDLDAAITLWSKIHELEKAFNVKFDPKSNVDNDDYYWITKLYSSIHHKLGTKKYIKISEFILTMDRLMNATDLDNLKKPDTLLSFNQTIKLNLLGADLIIHVVTAWYDYIITDITLDNAKDENSNYIIHLESKSNKGLIEFTTYFSNEDAATGYIQNSNKITEDYTKAKFINEIL